MRQDHRERAALGAADVSDGELESMVAAAEGVDPARVRLVRSRVSDVDYNIAAITTAGRYWVTVSAEVGDVLVERTFFLKLVQAWSRSPQFAYVPPAMRATAAAGVPWRTEALVYGSDLADRLPRGLRMPRVYAIRELDEWSVAIWIERVEAEPVRWDERRFVDAARRLGRLAGSERVRPLAAIGEFERRWTARDYVEGRLRTQVAPAVLGDDIWQHPLVARSFDAELRDRMREGIGRADAMADELMSYPEVTAHGDACPNNLLWCGAHDDMVLIDFGFWTTQPVGFDLGQLVLGDIQTGHRTAEGLAHLDALCTDAYTLGLADEGLHIDSAVVHRAHALQALIYSGLSAVPFEHLGSEPTPELYEVTSQRAAMARHLLDAVENG